MIRARKLGFVTFLVPPALALALLSWPDVTVRPAVADDRQEDRFAPVTRVPDGWMIIEEDIVVPEDFYQQPEGTYASNLWPGGVVPFIFDNNVSAVNQTLMLAAMAEWEVVANVDFRPRNGEPDFVRIQNATFNASNVGFLNQGEQDIWIFNWNFRFIMAHELAHTLGYWHEHSRIDRNSYVRINTHNIQPGAAHNFDIRPNQGPFGSGEYGPYDFDSVMHYGQWAFSTCAPNPGCETIIVLSPNQAWQNLIGQRNHLSVWDARVMSFLYPEPNWRFVDAAHTGNQSGSFFEPYRQFTTGVTNVPSGGTLWIQPGNYSAAGTWSKPMTIRAPIGGATLGG